MSKYLDSVLPVVVVEERGQVGRKEAAADAGFGEDHHDLFAVHGQGCRDLRADKPTADHGEALPACRLLTQALVVLDRAVVVDPMAADRKTAGRHAGREQQLVEAVLGSPVVDDALVLKIEHAAGAAEMEINPKLIRAQPHAVQRFALPELLGEGWSLVGRVRFGADQSDRSIRIDLANSAGGRIGRHTAADDEIGVHVVIHRSCPPLLRGNASSVTADARSRIPDLSSFGLCSSSRRTRPDRCRLICWADLRTDPTPPQIALLALA